MKTGIVKKNGTPAGLDIESLRKLKLTEKDLAEAKRRAEERTKAFRGKRVLLDTTIYR